MKTKILILILILLSSLILNCSSRRKKVLFEKEGKTEIERINVDSVKSEIKKTETKKITDREISQKKDEVFGDIIIKGKTDSANHFDFHNVVNGDTLQSISINGNSVFEIKNHFEKSEKKEVEKSKEENLNFIQKIARKSVSKETIKEVAAEFKKSEKEVKATGFVFPIYFIIGLAVLVLIILIFLWKKFGRNFLERLNKKR